MESHGHPGAHSRYRYSTTTLITIALVVVMAQLAASSPTPTARASASSLLRGGTSVANSSFPHNALFASEAEAVALKGVMALKEPQSDKAIVYDSLPDGRQSSTAAVSLGKGPPSYHGSSTSGKRVL
jgi:hypothetical protein